MHITFYDLGRRYHIYCRNEVPDGALARLGAAIRTHAALRDEWLARSFIERHFRDAFALSRLRHALAAETGDLARYTDDDVIRAAVLRLTDGAWRVQYEEDMPSTGSSAAFNLALTGTHARAGAAVARRSGSAGATRASGLVAMAVQDAAMIEWPESADQIAQAEVLEQAARSARPFCALCAARARAIERMHANE